MDKARAFLTRSTPAQNLVLTSYLIAIASLAASIAARVMTMLDTSFIASLHISPNHDSWGIPGLIALIMYGFCVFACSIISGILALCMIKKHPRTNLYEGLPHKHQNDIVSTFEALILAAYAIIVIMFWAQYTYVNKAVAILDVLSYIGYTYYVVSVLALSSIVYTNITNWLQDKRAPKKADGTHQRHYRG